MSKVHDQIVEDILGPPDEVKGSGDVSSKMGNAPTRGSSPPISRFAWCGCTARILAEATKAGVASDVLDKACQRLRIEPLRLCEAVRDEWASRGGA